MKFIYTFLLFLGSLSCTKAQVFFVDKALDFQEIDTARQIIAEFLIKNNSSKNAYVLRVDLNKNMQIKKPKVIPAGGLDTLKIFFDPEQKGAFNEKITAYLSSQSEPITLIMKGDVKYYDENYLDDCYAFNSPKRKILQKEITIQVVDSITGEPLEKARVEIVSLDEEYRPHFTNKKGQFQLSLKPNLYQINTAFEGYELSSITGYFNMKSNLILIKLKPIPQDIPDSIELVFHTRDRDVIAEIPSLQQLKMNQQKPELQVTTKETQAPKPPSQDELDALPSKDLLALNNPQPKPAVDTMTSSTVLPKTIDEIDSLPSADIKDIQTSSQIVVHEKPIPDPIAEAKEEQPILDSKEMPYAQYKSNNIVFLLDVSGSMNYENRMSLLKQSLTYLSQQLRSVDKITIVAFSTKSHVILPTTTGLQRDSIVSLVSRLRGFGVTAPNKGIQMAYQELMNNYNQEVNNQLILVTDGEFDLPEESIDKIKENESEYPIHFSVLGMDNNRHTQHALKKMADKLDGTFITIKNESQVETLLLEEIKAYSKRD